MLQAKDVDQSEDLSKNSEKDSDVAPMEIDGQHAPIPNPPPPPAPRTGMIGIFTNNPVTTIATIGAFSALFVGAGAGIDALGFASVGGAVFGGAVRAVQAGYHSVNSFTSLVQQKAAEKREARDKAELDKQAELEKQVKFSQAEKEEYKATQVGSLNQHYDAVLAILKGHQEKYPNNEKTPENLKARFKAVMEQAKLVNIDDLREAIEKLEAASLEEFSNMMDNVGTEVHKNLSEYEALTEKLNEVAEAYEKEQAQQHVEQQKRAELEEQKRLELEEQKRAELEDQKRLELEEQKRVELEEQKRAELEEQKRVEQLEQQKRLEEQQAVALEHQTQANTLKVKLKEEITAIETKWAEQKNVLKDCSSAFNEKLNTFVLASEFKEVSLDNIDALSTDVQDKDAFLAAVNEINISISKQNELFAKIDEAITEENLRLKEQPVNDEENMIDVPRPVIFSPTDKLLAKSREAAKVELEIATEQLKGAAKRKSATPKRKLQPMEEEDSLDGVQADKGRTLRALPRVNYRENCRGGKQLPKKRDDSNDRDDRGVKKRKLTNKQ